MSTGFLFLELKYNALFYHLNINLLISQLTAMSVLLFVGPKCTLAASHASLWCVTVSMPTGLTDGRTNGRQTVTLRFPLDAASVNFQHCI